MAACAFTTAATTLEFASAVQMPRLIEAKQVSQELYIVSCVLFDSIRYAQGRGLLSSESLETCDCHILHEH